jgi:hypothetical protein
MRVLIGSLGAALLLGGCVAAVPPPARTAYVAPPAYAPVVAADPNCREERREAQVAQRVANREAREARAYGGRRQAYEAAAAQSEADRQRWQAQRAC